MARRAAWALVALAALGAAAAEDAAVCGTWQLESVVDRVGARMLQLGELPPRAIGGVRLTPAMLLSNPDARFRLFVPEAGEGTTRTYACDATGKAGSVTSLETRIGDGPWQACDTCGGLNVLRDLFPNNSGHVELYSYKDSKTRSYEGTFRVDGAYALTESVVSSEWDSFPGATIDRPFHMNNDGTMTTYSDSNNSVWIYTWRRVGEV